MPQTTYTHGASKQNLSEVPLSKESQAFHGNAQIELPGSRKWGKSRLEVSISIPDWVGLKLMTFLSSLLEEQDSTSAINFPPGTCRATFSDSVYSLSFLL